MKRPLRAAIMQPYFLPYIGYWQLLHAVDVFVVYDDIQYTKKGWINRNRMLSEGKDVVFSLPLAKDSDFLDIRDRRLAPNFEIEREKLLRRFEASYRRAPYFQEGMALLRDCLSHADSNAFRFLHHSILSVAGYLDISTPIVVSSTLGIDRALRSQDRVIATCLALGAGEYINPIGGTTLYDPTVFLSHGITLRFQKVLPYEYEQVSRTGFVPHLSILDWIMHLPSEKIREHLPKMELTRSVESAAEAERWQHGGSSQQF